MIKSPCARPYHAEETKSASPSPSQPRLVIAGTHSGVGKTTVSLALMAAFSRRKLEVRPFKIGPDYIDPSLHQAAAGAVSHNLDAWLLPDPRLLRLFLGHAAPKSGLSLIEGVMGLFDGLEASAAGSTAHVASLLTAPVALVLNAEGLALSAAALVFGLASFRPRFRSAAHPPDLSGLTLAGIILNRVSGPSHYQLLRRCIEEETGIPCFGGLVKDAIRPLAVRHLGLAPIEEQQELGSYLAGLAEAAEAALDLDGLLALAQSAPALAVPDSGTQCGEKPTPASGSHPVPSLNAAVPDGPIHRRAGLDPKALNSVRVAIAKDAAFSFYYQDNLDLLEESGAQLLFFSPLRDASLPPDIQGLYLGGGFPECFAAALEANKGMRLALRAALERGLPALAEGGGMLYLCDRLTVADKDEERDFAMTGFFPQIARMTGSLQRPFGYVTLTLEQDCPLGKAGSLLRAHEFHYSRLVPGREDSDAPPPTPVYTAVKTDGRSWSGGLCRKRTLALYPHLHFHACPEAASAFLAACREYGELD